MNQHDYDSPTAPFEIGRYRIPCRAPARCHWHGNPEFYTALAGTLDCLIYGQTVRLNAGESVFINCGMLYMVSNSGGPPAEVFRFELPVCGRDVPAFMVFAPAEEVSVLLYRLSECFWDGAQTMECFERLCRQILFYMERERPEQNAMFFPSESDLRQAETAKEILEYLHTHFQETISIQALSRSLYIGQSGFFRCFKRFTNTTPVQYLNSFRLMKAEALLCNSRDSISEIGRACGFCSASYFGRAFKRQYQLSPMQYRKNRPPDSSAALP